jgi:hypothetical protein
MVAVCIFWNLPVKQLEYNRLLRPLADAEPLVPWRKLAELPPLN